MTSDAPDTGLRERKKRRTRDELEMVAMRLFERHGFDSVTVEDIAAEVEVSPRTFFRYFPSKEDVLFRDLEEQLATLHASIRSGPPDEPVLETVRRSVTAFVINHGSASHLQRHRILIQIVTGSSQLGPRLLGKMAAKQEELAAVIAERRAVDPDSDMYSRLIAACAVDALRVSLEIWERSTPHRPAVDIVGEAFDLLAKGFG